MPPSQLKQLKASLHNSGLLGQQKSKKQRKNNSKDASKRLQRNAALEDIREKFNPFEAKGPARKEKFDIASSRPVKKTIERPGVTRGLGEERRRATLLKEMQSRNKVGGMLDRRFGEDDPNMTPEQKAAERFAQQALRSSKKNDMFNLEDGSDEEMQLTHGGRVLGAGSEEKSLLRDDFDEQLSGSDGEDFNEQDDRPRKRQRTGEEVEDGSGEEQQLRRKTKTEVMQEVMAKSKAYKAARQAQKENDDDLRAELDQGLQGIFSDLAKGPGKLKSQLPSPPVTDSEPVLDPGRAALLAGKSRAEADKEYETNIRQLKIEARSKPSKRSKTEEEKATEEKEKLEEMEKDRLRRMRGESITSDEDAISVKGVEEDQDDEYDDAEAFGLDQPAPRYIPDLAVEDEDEFVMDDILASDSEAEADSDDSKGDGDDSSADISDDGDDDFINGLVLPSKSDSKSQDTARVSSEKVPYTFSCPETLEELIKTTEDVKPAVYPTIVQRIRALYHKGLAEGNNDKLAAFSQTLLPWIVMLTRDESPKRTPLHIIEQLIRHLHSMAKAYPHEVASSFREHLRTVVEKECNLLDAGDLMVLTAVSTIFPTSDLWHSVVSPSMLILARYLGQAVVETQDHLAKSIYACSLILRYQKQSQRYVPEAITFLTKAIQLLVPAKNTTKHKLPTPKVLENYAQHLGQNSNSTPATSLSFDLIFRQNYTGTLSGHFVAAILSLIDMCIHLYRSKPAWPEISATLQHTVTNYVLNEKCQSLLYPTTITQARNVFKSLEDSCARSVASRKPLFLHNHKPLAIKSSFPLFDDQYNPTRRQRDPDAERAELNKLRAEHKKEKKGAVRELRKDANFMAREQLREKKAKDEAYKKKFKRLVAEIQGEEGHEAKSYERERAKRKSRF